METFGLFCALTNGNLCLQTKQLLTFGEVSNPDFWKLGMQKPVQCGLVLLHCFLTNLALATDSTQKAPSPWSYLLHAEAFVAFDYGLPSNGNRQDFFFNHNRHAQPAVNLAVGKLGFEKERWRANLALLAGTYSADNYAAEPPLLRHLLEANVGYRLHRSASLWLEAGVFPSHIGFESAFSFDNLTLSRSILAENSPYFLSGAQVKYTKNHWQAALLLLNGWQRIALRADQRLPAFGTQINRTFGNWVINWSSFTGLSEPETARLWRTFHNTYAIWKPSERFTATFGFDVGWQKQTNRVAQWYSPVLMGRYGLTKEFFVAGRIEYYTDPNGAHIPAFTEGGFRSWGFSGNLDYQRKHYLMRLEARHLQSPTAALNQSAKSQSDNLSFILSISTRLQGKIPKH